MISSIPDNIKLDIYISTWDIFGNMKSPKIYTKDYDWVNKGDIMSASDINKIKLMYNPVNIEIDCYANWKLENNFRVKKFVDTHKNLSYSHINNTFYSQFYRIKRGYQLIENSGISYDLIIKTRPDVLYSDIKPEKWDIFFEKAKYSLVSNGYFTSVSIKDIFFSSSPQIFKVISEISENLDNIDNDTYKKIIQKYNYQIFTPEALITNTIEVNGFKFKVVDIFKCLLMR